ncbi:MAG: acyltransferase family protein [Clostridiales bacterium]|nr:acyltransferase family protein [Clostridiales bacterium]
MELTITLYICLAVLGAILFTGSSKRPANEMAFFDRISSKEIQGVLAVFIMFHQTVVALDANFKDAGDMMFFYYYGILAVSFFFFSSGFGLLKRWMTDKDYIKGFMKRRIFTVLVPFFICNYIYLTDALLNNIIFRKHFGFGEVICSFFGIFLVNNEMWFAVEIMILYVAFRIVFSKVKKPLTGILIMTGVVLAMMTIGLFSGHSNTGVMSYWFKGEWWYNTIFMFPIGMLYAYKEERINKVIKRSFVSILLASSILLVLLDYIHRGLILDSIYWTEYTKSPHPLLDKLHGLGVETLFELVFLILVITIISRIKIGNPVIKFFGKISLEIIMLNYLMIDKLFFLYTKYGIRVYLPAVVVGTLVCASVVYIIKNIVLERKSGLFDGKVT